MPRTAIVTGGTRGLGRAIALALLRDGFQVVLNYRFDDGAAARALDECSAAAERVRAVRADVSRREDVDRLMRDTLDLFGSIDVLVNNASRNVDRPFLEMSDEEWDVVIASNLTSAFMCSQAAARRMTETGGGVIVNVGATTAIRGRRNGANYCASKAGVLVLTKCLALELAPAIRVNCVVPGSIENVDAPDPARAARLVGGIPIGRLGRPCEVAEAVSYLVSDRAAYVTGQKLIVDGGQFMH